MEKNNSKINEIYIDNVPPLSTFQNKVLLSQLEKKVCKIHKNNGQFGTGFLCKMPYPNQFQLLPVLITNNHVLNEEDIKINKTIKISFGDEKTERILTIDKSRITYTNPDDNIDITIIEIKPNLDNLHYFLDIDEDIFEQSYEIYKNQPIYILQYPKGIESSHSEGSIKNIYNSNIQHLCSTDFGSSGSPILNLYTLKVIGVHKRKTKYNINEGTLINFIVELFKAQFYGKMNKEININQQVIEDNFNNFQFSDFYNEDYEEFKYEKNFMLNTIKTLINNLMNFVDIEWIKEFIRGYEDEEEFKPGPKINILFTTKIGTKRNIVLSHGKTIDQALRKYLDAIGRGELYGNAEKISFLFNSGKLEFGNSTPIEKFFIKVMNPKVVVNF